MSEYIDRIVSPDGHFPTRLHTPMQREKATGVAHRRRASSGKSSLLDCTQSPKGSMSAGADGYLI